MDHPADSAAELRQGGKDWYVGWQGIPMNSCPRETCKSVKVFKSGTLSEVRVRSMSNYHIFFAIQVSPATSKTKTKAFLVWILRCKLL